MRISDWSSDVCSSDLILDFVSVRGLFKKGEADPKIVVVIAESVKPSPDGRLLHAVFRRNGRATAEQGFDIDYYDLHWLKNGDAERSRDIWRANLLGGSRVHDLIERLREYPTLKDFAAERGWDFGEGYIAGLKGISRPADHLIRSEEHTSELQSLMRNSYAVL